MRLTKIQAVVVADTQAFDQALAKSDQATKAFVGSTASTFRKLDNQLKALADAGGQTAESYKKMSAALKSGLAGDAAARSLNKIASAAKLTDAEIKKLASDMGLSVRFNTDSQAAKSLNTTLNQLKGAALAYLGVTSLQSLGGKAADFIMAAGRYETLGVAMYQVGANAGYSKAELDAYEASMRKTGIAMSEARESITRLASAQVDLSEASQLARIAQDAAIIGGVNSTEAFERLVHGMTTGQTEVLRTIGIQVNFEQAYAKMAVSLGKTTAALTDEEKMQARVNAVMEQGAKIAGTYEKSLDSAYKKMTSLPRYFDEIQVMAGKVGSGLFGDVIDSVTTLTKGTHEWLNELERTGQLESYGKSLATTIKGIAGYAGNAAAAFAGWQIATRAIIPAASALKYELQFISLASAEMGKLNAATATFGNLTGKAKAGLSGIVTSLGGPWAIALTAAAAGIYAIATADTAAEREAKKYGLTLDDLAKHYEEIEKRAKGAEDATNKYAIANRQAAEDIRKLAEQQQADAEATLTRLRTLDTSTKTPTFFEAMGMSVDGATFGGEFTSANKAVQEYKKNFQGIIDDYKAGSVSAKDAADKMAELRLEMEQLRNQKGLSAQIANELDFIISKSDEARVQFLALGETIRTALGATVNFDSHVSAFNKAIADAQAETARLYAGTAEGRRSAAEAAINQAQERFNLLGTKEAEAVLRKAKNDLADLNNKAQKSGNASPRAAFQASEVYEKLTDSTEQFRLKNAELMEQLRGAGLSSALIKIEKDYAAQLAGIEKKERELINNRAEYAKTGKLDTYENALLEINAQKQLVEENRRLNEEIARRADLERTLKAEMDYSGMVGDLRSLYDAEVKLLGVEIQKTSNLAEQAALREKIRQATARRDMDVAGLLDTGWMSQSKQAQQDYIEFFEKDVPGAFSSAGGAWGDLVGSVLTGSKSFGDAFSDLGKTMQNVIAQMISDFASLQLRMLMFGGQGGGGGLLGGLFSGLGGMGGMTASAGAIPSLGGMSFGWYAKGGAFPAGTLSQYSNSIVDRPTTFSIPGLVPFAKGGVMGEAGPEAIMPLDRDSRGRLGVSMVGSGAASPVNIFINNTVSDDTAVQVRETPTANGGVNLDLLIERKMTAFMGSPSGKQAMKTNYGLQARTSGRG